MHFFSGLYLFYQQTLLVLLSNSCSALRRILATLKGCTFGLGFSRYHQWLKMFITIKNWHSLHILQWHSRKGIRVTSFLQVYELISWCLYTCALAAKKRNIELKQKNIFFMLKRNTKWLIFIFYFWKLTKFCSSLDYCLSLCADKPSDQ